jgi:prephenate dehydrogenase
MKKNEHIELSVIGLGRFGQFWAKHLNRFYPTYIFDLDERKAKLNSNIGKWASLERCLKKKYIFLTIPIRQIKFFLIDNENLFEPGTVLVDCASVKKPILDWFGHYVSDDVFYVASHPLFGPDSAREGLKGQKITLLPGKIPHNLYQILVELFAEKMELMVINMPAEEHDWLMAYNLSLIHHLGRTFNELEIYKLPLLMAGLEKMNLISQTVMNDTEELFQDFYQFNPYAMEVQKKFVHSFEKIFNQLTK